MAKEIFTAPWYPWYAGDVLASERVKLLTLAEEGAYRRALDHAWREGSVPSDPANCARVIGNGCTTKIAKKVLETCFYPMPSDPTRSLNKKLEKIRKEQEQKSRQKSDAGRRGMANRWKQKSKSDNSVITPPITKHNYTEREKESSSYEEDSKNSLSTHPAVVAMQEITGMRPEKDQRIEIVERLGVDVDIGKLTDVYRKWRARGYAKTNYEGIIDWYISGVPKAGKQNGTNQRNANGAKQTPGDIIENRPYR